jgi:hypothetical protein
MGHQLPRVGALLRPAVVERRPVHAGLHGLGSPARWAGRGVVLGPEHDPRREPAEPVADVPERRPAAGDDLVGHAQEVHLGQRLHVVRRVPGELVLLVARLVHAHGLAGGRRRLPVLPPDVLVVPRAQPGHQNSLRPRAGRRWTRWLLRHHVGEQVLLRRAGEDLVQDVLERGVSVEHPDLDAQPLVGVLQVRVVEPRDQPPHLVRRVEEVVRQEVEHGVLLREQPVELLLVRRVQEERRHEVAVRPHQQPRRAAEEPPLVVAEEELVVVGAGVVEVDEDVATPGHGRRGVVALHQVPVALPHLAGQVLEVPDREALRQQPRRARERLAEDVAQRRRPVEEQDPVGEHGVEERRRHGQDVVPEAPVRHQDEVLAGARRVAVTVPGPEPRGSGPVRLGARAAPPLQRFVLAQPLDEVRGRGPRHVLAVERRAVAAEARALVEPRDEQAAEKLLCIANCTWKRRKISAYL